MLSKKRYLTITFHGSMKCKLLFHPIKTCGCSTCDEWDKFAKSSFDDNEAAMYGFINIEESPKVIKEVMCKHQVMWMNLVPYGDQHSRKIEDMDLKVDGSLDGYFWEDSVMVDDEKCVIKIELDKKNKTLDAVEATGAAAEIFGLVSTVWSAVGG